MNFGKYAIVDNVRHNLKLEPDLWWEFRPATSGDELYMAKFYENSSKIISGPENRPVNMGPHWIEIMWRELAVLFDSTNIPALDDPTKPILEKGASVEEVEAVLSQMPEKLVEELWTALGEAVLGWGPRLQPEDKPGKASKKS